MFCIYCGKKIAEDSESCPFCGKDVSGSLRPKAGTSPERRSESAHGRRKRKNRRKQWPLVLIFASAALLIAVLVLGLTMAGKEPKAGSPLPDPAGTYPAGQAGAELTAGSGESRADPLPDSGESRADPLPDSGESIADLLPGLWEERILVNGTDVFLTHLELRRNGEVILWDGYENSEIWDYYSGEYSRVEEGENGEGLLELRLSGEGEEHTTRVRISISDSDSGQEAPELTLIYEGGDKIPMLGEEERTFIADTTQPLPEKDDSAYDFSGTMPSAEAPSAPAPDPVHIPWALAGVPDHAMVWGSDELKEDMQDATGIRGRDIMLSDVWELTELNIYLGYVSGNDYDRMGALGELKNLTNLHIFCDEYENLEFLPELPYLTTLTLDGDLRDIGALRGCAALEELTLNSYVWDLSPLRSLNGLKKLSVTGYNITDISPIGGLQDLEKLYLDCSNLADLSPLRSLPALRELTIYHGKSISDIRPLESLGSLEKLSLTDCGIRDVSALSGLRDLKELEVTGSPLSDVGPLRGLTSLRMLNLFDDQISDVSPLKELKNLKKLYLHENNVSLSDRAALQSALPNTDIAWDYY